MSAARVRTLDAWDRRAWPRRYKRYCCGVDRVEGEAMFRYCGAGPTVWGQSVIGWRGFCLRHAVRVAAGEVENGRAGPWCADGPEPVPLPDGWWTDDAELALLALGAT